MIGEHEILLNVVKARGQGLVLDNAIQLNCRVSDRSPKGRRSQTVGDRSLPCQGITSSSRLVTTISAISMRIYPFRMSNLTRNTAASGGGFWDDSSGIPFWSMGSESLSGLRMIIQ